MSAIKTFKRKVRRFDSNFKNKLNLFCYEIKKKYIANKIQQDLKRELKTCYMQVIGSLYTCEISKESVNSKLFDYISSGSCPWIATQMRRFGYRYFRCSEINEKAYKISYYKF